MKNQYKICRKDNDTFYNEDYNVFCKVGTTYESKKRAIEKMEFARKYAISNENVKIEIVKNEMFYLKNITDGEIVDIYATSLDEAKQKASDFLGGKPNDYIERF